jgi:hypothetical protein
MFFSRHPIVAGRCRHDRRCAAAASVSTPAWVICVLSVLSRLHIIIRLRVSVQIVQVQIV